jgi:hypothetical protein
MRSGERETRCRMVECRRRPGRSRVAERAIVIELTIDMIGIGRRRERRLVTRVAVGRRAGITAGMTRRTLLPLVSAGQNKVLVRIGRVGPGAGSCMVTGLALG